ncbi:DUF6172 family protein [Polaromonas sp. YR568]|uniref:DUF6172 family protein n=1 Tax=Polaromonas sp. YR568 TaxID=1855301 RepID=UPI00313785B7
MKKTYQLQIAGKHPDRLLDAVKHDIRRYLKRERAKALPAGADFWDFDCRCGASEPDATVVPVADLISLVDACAREGRPSVYVEVLAKPGLRVPRSDASFSPAPGAGGDSDSGL